MESMWLKPPALTYAQIRRQEVSVIRIGAEYFSSSLIPSIPFQTIANWATQKTMKQANSSGDVPSQGKNCDKEEFLIELGSRRKIASPPIQVSIPYQPQPTKALRRVGI
jgi:hypothetical protein